MIKRSVSNEGGLATSAVATGFMLPSVVLVIPVQQREVEEEDVLLWDFDLLTEDEVRACLRDVTFRSYHTHTKLSHTHLCDTSNGQFFLSLSLL